MELKELDKAVYTGWYMKRTYWYYSFLSFFTFAWLIASILVFIFVNSLWIQICTIVVFTFFRMQVWFLAHDFSHNQVFKSKTRNKVFGYFLWGLISGVSQDYWTDKHNRHHDTTNQSKGDPDLDIPFLLSPNHNHIKNKILRRCIVPYQHILFFFSLPFVYILIIYESYKYIILTRKGSSYLEMLLITGNIVAIAFMLIYVQGLLIGLILLALHFLLAGMYMSLSFAPNHIGQEIIHEDAEYERVFQIRTSRNLNPSFLGTFIFGSLDYQIEHHLYPTMPRKNYKKVWPMVKAFCEKHWVPYSQTSFAWSMKEIYVALRANAKI